MTTYSFETITPEQARAIRPGDRVTVTSGTASQTTVIFQPAAANTIDVAVTIGTRTVLFPNSTIFTNAPLFTVVNGLLSYADGSVLYVGTAADDNADLNPTAGSGSGGAYGSAGADSLRGTGNWLIQGNSGDDKIDLSGGGNVVYGGQDQDRITVGGVTGAGGALNFVQGNKGDDTISGSTGTDTLIGGQDKDFIQGRGGADFINGNLGDDSLAGGGVLLGEAGNDTLVGGFEGANTLTGGDGNDRISATIGVINGAGRSAVNSITGDAGDDTITVAGTESDTISGGSGNDMIGSTGTDPGKGDIIDGGDGDDTITTEDGLNLIRGGAGADILRGGNNGSDTIDAGLGADTISGGGGPDVFILDAKTSPLGIVPLLCDRITDWQTIDHIKLRAPLGAAQNYAEAEAGDFFAAIGRAGELIAGGQIEVVAVQVGADVLIFADAGSSNTVETATFLVGRSLADISSDNFL